MRVLRYIILFIVAMLCGFALAHGAERVERRGIIYYHGQREAALHCEINTRQSASVYFRNRMYFLPAFSTVEIRN